MLDFLEAAAEALGRNRDGSPKTPAPTPVDPTSDPVFPHDPDAERQLVGCLMADPSIDADLPANQLFDVECHSIYSMLLEMKADGVAINPENVCEWLARSPLPYADNGTKVVEKLVNDQLTWPPDSAAGPYAARFETAAKHINDCFIRRQIIQRLTAAPLLATLRTCDLETVFANADLSDLAPAVRKPRIPLQTGAEFKQANAAAQSRYLVPNILLAGEPGVICGPPNTQKTAIAMDLLISVAAGRKFLNHFPVAHNDPTLSGPTLLITAETTPAALRGLYERICRWRGVDADTLKDFYISTDLPKLDDHAGLARLRDLISQKQLKVVVIDPAHLALGLGQRRRDPDAPTPQETLKKIAQLSRSTGCSILFVHHTRRDVADPEWPAKTTEIIHGPFAEFAAQWMQISRRQRSDPQSGNHALWLACGNQARASGHWSLDVSEGEPDNPNSEWDVGVGLPHDARLQDHDQRQIDVDERRDRKRAALLPRHRTQVVNILKEPEYHFGATATQLRDLLGWSGSRINRVLVSLQETHAVQHNLMHKGRGGVPLWQLTNERLYLCYLPANESACCPVGVSTEEVIRAALSRRPADDGPTSGNGQPCEADRTSDSGFSIPPERSAEGGLDFGMTEPITGPAPCEADRTAANEADRTTSPQADRTAAVSPTEPTDSAVCCCPSGDSTNETRLCRACAELAAAKPTG